MDLDAHKGEHRLFLIFAPSSRDDGFVRQDRLLAGSGRSFAVLLIGKDGTVKHRSGKPVEPGEIFSLVDTMPMRQRELREI